MDGVIEDAPAGLQAACSAGMRSIAVATTHPPEALSQADLVVGSLVESGPEAVTELLNRA